MSSKGWFNLESQSSIASASNLIPDNQFFEGDSAFSFLKLSRTTRLYGFIGWCVSLDGISGISLILLINMVILFTLLRAARSAVSSSVCWV